MSDVRGSYFNGSINRDFFDVMCGKLLGSGVGREVYVSRLDPTLVVKFEVGQRSFQNAMEWETWEELQHHKPSAKWLAPCVSISPCGMVLIQKRTQPLGTLRPPMIPIWATDTKVGNWGTLNGKPVMHDYGKTLLLGRGAATRLKKADWWGDEET